MKKLHLRTETLQRLDAGTVEGQGAGLVSFQIQCTLTRPSLLVRCVTQNLCITVPSVCGPCPFTLPYC